MNKISAVISAFNEEKKIGECLESVKWVDEIIFVDNNSTDKTVEIARKYNAKIFSRPNNLMLNVNKNFGFTKATSEWILNLDADERVSSELQEEIKSEIRQAKSSPRGKAGETNGYWIPRKNIIFGKWMQHTGWYPDLQLRLFRKGKGKFEEEHVHELIKVEGETDSLKGHLIHYNFESVDQFFRKHITIYAPSEVEALLEKGYAFNSLDAIRFPIKEFLSRFFAREGYKDGFHGLMLSLLLAFYHLIILAKIWEKEHFRQSQGQDVLKIVSEELKKSSVEVSYWITNEKLKSTKNILEKTLLQIQRKIKK